MDKFVCLDLSLPSVAEDLALDEALLIEADAGRGGPVLRFWEPLDYAVVLGASCRIKEDVLLDACRADGVRILRRPSGGGTVVVGPGVLCVSVILPENAGPSLSTIDGAHRYVLEWLAASIRSVGLPVTLEGRGDLVLGGRKFGGSAQRRLKHWFMVHCSILYDFAIERIVRYLALPRRQPEYRAGRSHQDFLSSLALPRKVLSDAIRGNSPAGSCSALAPALPSVLLQSLVSDRYLNPAWIERF
jgi:lipoate-protein ligase A